MRNSTGKWWLAAILIGCLAPAAFAERRGHGHGDGGGGGGGCGEDRHGDCRQVPEGGSTAIYLLGAGLTCFGAMFLRSRIGKPAHS
jgi:hypothetical protein